MEFKEQEQKQGNQLKGYCGKSEKKIDSDSLDCDVILEIEVDGFGGQG